MEENMKTKSVPKGKDRRPPYSQEGVLKRAARPNPTKTDPTQLPPPLPLDREELVRKILNEANKIIKIGMEKDHALLERENTLQNSNEVVENLRKNILHLQMEYEKLDQNYQREISHRAEVVKRMETTRETVESVMQSSDVLLKSLKQLEADKLRIADFYEIIYCNQKEVEAKHSKMEKFIKEQDDVLKSKLESINKCHERILSQHSETVSQLNKKLNYANDKANVIASENEKLSRRIEESERSAKRLESLLDQAKRLNREHEEKALAFRFSLKKVKKQRSKYQKLWKQKKLQNENVVKKNKNLKKSMKTTGLIYRQCSENNKALELKISEWEKKFQQHLEEDLAKLGAWENEKSELEEKAFGREAEIESLKAENANLSEKLLELSKIEISKRSELEQVQNDLSKLLSENLKLQNEVVKYSKESDVKKAVISELKKNAENSNSEFKAEIELQEKERKKLQELIKQKESEMADLQERIAFEKKERESIIFNFNCELEANLKTFNQEISDLKKKIDEKTTLIQKLQSERNVALHNEKSAEELNNQLQSEKNRNEELIKNLEKMKETQRDVNEELEKSKIQISEYLKKLSDVESSNKALSRAQTEWETKAANLKSQIESKKKSFEALEEKQKKAEKDLSKMNTLAQENSALKASLANSKSLLEATEARVEAYRVVVRKLECEKVDMQKAHSEEMSRLKAESARVEEASRAAKAASSVKPSSRLLTPGKNFDQTNKRETETPLTKSREKSSDFFLQKLNVKEIEPELGETDKCQNTSTPPLQNTKKFLATPRKIYTSSPQPNSKKNMSSAEKNKRDPYDFDSDSSVEKLDPDKVLKVLSRQKRESAKRVRTNK